MANFIKSKVQQSLSFLLMLVIAFSAFSGVLFVNPSPSYAFNPSDVSRAQGGFKQLSNADLSAANFFRLNLAQVDLSGADLSAANLSATNLIGANLSAANLIGANLKEANLIGANLIGANLSKANLVGAFADSKTKFPNGFDARGAGVRFRN